MKNFFDVFPTLKLGDELNSLVTDTFVEKITTTSAKDRITIYLNSTHLIPKKNIYELEDIILRDIFGRRNLLVHIEENYRLSRQYTPENLWNNYKESMLLELSKLSPLAAQIFIKTGLSFEGNNKVYVEFGDTLASKGKEKTIMDYVQLVFEERCHIPIELGTRYREAELSELEQYKEKKLAGEIEKILRHNSDTRKQKKQDDQPEKAPEELKDYDAKIKPFRPGRSGDPYKGRQAWSKTASADPEIIYGRDFQGEVTPLSQVDAGMANVVFRGQILETETRQLRNQKQLITFSVTDFTDSIMVKIFVADEECPDLMKELKKGACVKVCGSAVVDNYNGEVVVMSIRGIRKIGDFTEKRVDLAPVKRVELHCHTKMSDMDGITSAEDIVKGAVALGHKAVAITDHGVVHAFPEAFHTIRDLKSKSPEKVPEGFKIIYGMEGYVVDDLIDLVVNDKGQSFDDTFVVFDLETTGFNSIHDRIIEIGAVKIQNREIVDTFSVFVNPEVPIPYRITELTSITDEMVMDAEPIAEVLPKFLAFSEGAVMVAHNAGFDMGFIRQNCRNQGLSDEFTYMDTVALARVLLPTLSRYKLDAVAKQLGISLENHHRAVDDAGCTAEIFLKFMEMLKERKINTLAGVNQIGSMTPDMIRKLPTHHIILLAKNEEGRKNLYRLVSKSHLVYFGKRPRLPKSEIISHRDGLILGSACVAGELFDALLSGRSAEEVQKIVKFYDYLEVQPLANNRFLIGDDKHPEIKSDEELKDFNREIIRLGEAYNKPVVATCDVHFLNPEDEICRRIIQAGNGYKDVDRPEPLYLRTTTEMLKEFSYLGEREAEKIVIENTLMINDMIEEIEPVRPDKCPPVIPDSDRTLRESCYARAKEIYGEPLPDVVTKRLEKELHSIISNGFAVMYIIAQKLVRKSNEDGYLVGSRGSVGSSFVANMAGITEVNALTPHYYCPECHYYDFDSDDVKAYVEGCGWDMPDKICPKCGHKLKKDGFNIPFETFLGFKGNKEPDIDLNFSGDYQAKAHRYTEEIFGKGQTFKAGTIATLADKTAYGYVKHYFEDRGKHKRTCEINRIVQQCTGVRRSTGQHPGGIIVLPHGEEIDTFTPVQHPANDMKTDIITTHFDYHSIDHNLLKLDILGHDDPTMIRRLEDLTGLKAKEIPLDDPGVISLFAGTEALGIKPADIHGCKLGCLGIPEFGTDFVIQMLQETKPKSFSDLIRVSGLSHGTNVWVDNAQTLIAEGKTDLGGAICTRDDIMTFLIHEGMESSLAFDIMEGVRKGKGLRPEWEKSMKEAGIPDWYIWSCKRISYMFPKAHAVAYVTMAYRIAYCKINYPLAYYAAYFAIRASAFSYEIMCRGANVLKQNFERLESIETLSPKEEDTIKDMRIVEEMYARGFEFMPIDIYRADARHFQVIDGKIMPSLSSIDGLGEKAADSLAEAAAQGKFLSKDDIRGRGKVPRTVVDKMQELGLLEGLPESNQLSLFDL